MPSARSDGGGDQTVFVALVIGAAVVLLLVCLGGGGALFLSMRADERTMTEIAAEEARRAAADRLDLVERAGVDPEAPAVQEAVAERSTEAGSAEAVAVEAVHAAAQGAEDGVLRHATEDLDRASVTKLISDLSAEGDPDVEPMAGTTRGADGFESLLVFRRGDRIVKLRITLERSDGVWRVAAIESDPMR